MDLKTVIDSAPTLKKPRRTFTTEFKQHLIQQCQQPYASVAKVAMQHQINANLLHKWIRQSESMLPVPEESILQEASHQQPNFLPLVLHSAPVREEPQPVPTTNNPVAHLRIPLHEGPGSERDQMIEIEWPVESTTELLFLLQGLIK
jgi:transposase-like protein